MPILRHKPGATRKGGNLWWLITSSNCTDVPLGEMMDTILVSWAKTSSRKLIHGPFAIVASSRRSYAFDTSLFFYSSPTIAGKRSNVRWNGMRDLAFPLLADAMTRAGGIWARTVRMARGNAATLTVRAKEDYSHAHR